MGKTSNLGLVSAKEVAKAIKADKYGFLGTFFGWILMKVLKISTLNRIYRRNKHLSKLEFLDGILGEFQIKFEVPAEDLKRLPKDGAYIRKTLFETDPYLKELAQDFSDSDLWQMTRGGHDPRKVYAAFAHALKMNNQKPTVILVKTIKGYGMGHSGESANIAHNVKKMELDSLKEFRTRFHVPLSDQEIDKLPFLQPPQDSEEFKFIHEQRKKLGGYLPDRKNDTKPIQIPEIDTFKTLLQGSGDKNMSTTMAFVRYISTLTKDKNIGKKIVPIVPDEARTFGMEGLFRQIGIYAPTGQLYEPEDASSFAWYKEANDGQILEEGISEAGAISSWISAGTAHINYGIHMIPFYIFYSMFGFQRIGDLAWLAGDIRAKGFLLGATSGRTTLNGEGLQHQDGHSHLLASTIPNCISYDPTFAYEVVVLIQEGLKRMYVDQEDIFYYITLTNENYLHPPMPEGSQEGIKKGIYLFKKGEKSSTDLQLMGSGSILTEVIKAGEILEDEFNFSCNIWSVPGINQLYKEGLEFERKQKFSKKPTEKLPFITETLNKYQGPAIIATDYVKAYPERLRNFIPMPYHVLGTDGFGRSDTREKLREYFEIGYKHIIIAALKALYQQNKINQKDIDQAMKKYSVDLDRPNPSQS